MNKSESQLEFLQVYKSLKKNAPGYAAYVKSEKRHIEKYGCRKYSSYSEFLETLKNEFVQFKL